MKSFMHGRVWVRLVMLLAGACWAEHASAKHSAAPPTPVQRACEEQDVSGIFYLKSLTEEPKGQETSWLIAYPYHYILFQPDHTYEYLASHRVMATNEALEQMIKSTSVGVTHSFERKYTLDDDGILKLYVDDRLDHVYRCMFALKASRDTRNGDLIFTEISNSNAKLRKIFRPWRVK